MLIMRSGRQLYISCLFCPTRLHLEVCYSPQCAAVHFLSEGLVTKSFDDRKDWKKFHNGILLRLDPDSEAKKFIPKLMTSDAIFKRKTWCRGQDELLPVSPNFGLGQHLSVWLCAHCSFKNKKKNERLAAIHDTLSAKSKIWKEYWNETEPKFLAEAEIDKRIRDGL